MNKDVTHKLVDGRLVQIGRGTDDADLQRMEAGCTGDVGAMPADLFAGWVRVLVAEVRRLRENRCACGREMIPPQCPDCDNDE